MTKQEMIKEIAQKTGNTNKESKKFLDALGEIIYEHIADDDGLRLVNGLKLYTVLTDKRNVRNPRSGETMTVGPRRLPRARFGACLKDTLTVD